MPLEPEGPSLSKEMADKLIPFVRADDFVWNIKPISRRRRLWWRLCDRHGERFARLRNRVSRRREGDEIGSSSRQDDQ